MCKVKLLAMTMMLLLMVTVACGEESSQPPISAVDELLENGAVSEVTEIIPPQAQELLDSKSIRETVDGVTPATLMETVIHTVKNYATAPLRMLVSLCGIMVLCGIMEVFGATLGTGGSKDILQVVIAVAVASVIVSPVVTCITEAAVVLRDYALFIVSYIPIFAGIITASGQPLTAVAYNIFLFWICQMTSKLISSYFVPLLCGYLALAVISVVCPMLKLGKLVSGIKTFVVWGLTLTITIFVGLLSIQSVVASGGDNVTVKTAKFMIGSLVPGVGGALSDLFVAAQGCIQLAKGTLGAFGVVVTLFTFLPILIRVLLWYLSLNIASLVGNVLGVQEMATLMKSISSTLGIILAVLLYDSLLVIISTTIMIVTFGVR